MSEQTKHTPGSWYARGPHSETPDFNDHAASVGICSTDDGGLIALIEPFGEWTAEKIANIHLIAAAPDLLQAVKELIGDLSCASSSRLRSCQKGLIERCVCRQCTRDRAKAAIAKAEGLS